MTLPRWLSWSGLGLHLVVGAAVALILHVLGASVLVVLVAAILIGIVHEHDDDVPGKWFSDFQRANGGPWNGLLDVAAFGVGAAICLLAVIR